MYFVYVIYNRLVNKIYIGQTKNIEERIRIHNEKIICGYTSKFKCKWEVIYLEKTKNRQEALRREKQLKSFRGREFIKNFIPG